MPRQVAILAGALVIAVALAVVFWIVNILFAPHIFFFVWNHLWGGQRSPLVSVLLAAIAPILVAIPFGCGFGFLPWRRPMLIALLVAVLAAALNLAHSVWALMWAGHPLFDSRSWVVLLEAALLIVLFGAAATFGAAAASRWRERQRLAAGSIVLAGLTAITLVGAYVWYQSVLESARAA
jgi:hypothetical protein